LKSYKAALLKKELTHLDIGVGYQITPACIHSGLKWTPLINKKFNLFASFYKNNTKMDIDAA